MSDKFSTSKLTLSVNGQIQAMELIEPKWNKNACPSCRFQELEFRDIGVYRTYYIPRPVPTGEYGVKCMY